MIRTDRVYDECVLESILVEGFSESNNQSNHSHCGSKTGETTIHFVI